MFTGLVETTGTVLSLRDVAGGTKRLVVAAPQLAGKWSVGDSIAVNGVCLTALDVEEGDEEHPGRFCADLAEETVARTTLGQLAPGALVNLELPTRAGTPVGGHVVQGHVDGTATLVSLLPLKPDLDRTDWRMILDLPPYLAASVIPQGSITVDGISLTVARVHAADASGTTRVEIAIIPHTYHATHLHALMSGAAVNIETDVLSKYAARRAEFGSEAARTAWHSVWTDAPVSSPAPETVAASSAVSSGGSPARAGEWLTAEYLMANGY